MQIDYKRDLNHTYVILQEEKEPDTASYQIRMLLTNAIPGLLDCKIGKMDDKTLFYYEVTSRQSLQSVFEQRSIGAEALRKLFEQLLDLLEELGQYLLAPDGLVLQPELVFADANLENFSFCYLPGKQRHTGCFQKQIRELMEYLLPKLDHQEQDAVVLGYGLYREISAEIFSVEMIQALLYQTGKEKKETTEQEGKERPREENPPVQMEETLWGEQEAEAAENFFVEAEEEKDEGRWKNIVEAVICIGFLGGVLALRWTQAETVWYLVLGGAAAVSAGASGAIFSAVGAMLVLLAFRKGRLEDLTFRRMAVMAVLSLLVGFQSSNVDNFAHIGGFLAGAVLMAVLYPGMARIRKRGKRP